MAKKIKKILGVLILVGLGTLSFCTVYHTDGVEGIAILLIGMILTVGLTYLLGWLFGD